MRRKKKELNVEPNVTPLCDAAMTLIVVFIMTLPAVMWSGFKFDAPGSKKSENKQMQEKKKEPSFAAVQITSQGVFFNGNKSSMNKLLGQLRGWVEKLKDRDKDISDKDRDMRTVIILPDDDIKINSIVRVMDIAKLAGAEKFALLDSKKK